MWSPLVVLLFVGLTSAEYGWKPKTEYKYQIKGRTLAALHQVTNEYVGVVSRAKLVLQPQSSSTVVARISDAQYSPLQTSLPGGWDSKIPEKELNYRSLPLSSKPFQIKFMNGVVDGLVVSKDLSTPEVNLIKSVVSQLQVDTRGENEIKWQHGSQTPKRPSESVFRAMEDTVTGECEVMYDISPLPLYATQVNPELVPMPDLRGDGLIYDIVKTKNFSNCEKRVAYHYGITGLTDWEPADNQMGQFFSRSGVSRILISGSLNKYTIQSSVTWNKIILSPAMYNTQKGMVNSKMNLTLESVRSSSGSPPTVPNPRNVKDLVYDYNDPFSSEKDSRSSQSSGKNFENENGRKKSESVGSNSSSEDDSSDSQSNSQVSGSSSSDSSEENDQSGKKRAIPKRFRRSTSQKSNNVPSSESDSSSSSSSSNGNSSESNSSSSMSSNGEGSLSGSSSSSSSSEEHNPKPGMSKPPKNPLLPFFIGYQGSSIQDAKGLDPVSAVKKLCSQIASELKNPDTIPQKATLSKFSIVVRLIRTMDLEQLQKITSQIYVPKSSGESEWFVYRDAVATAATGPCLTHAMSWIKTRMIVNEEAAEIVATISYATRTPTVEFIKTYFNLATCPEVTKQPLLNTTAILSFANIVRKAQVNKLTAHNHFPVHSFGRLSPINPKDITEKYIPYMAKHLRSAVSDADSHKIQVYIRALGNLGHPKILSVFEPYLEGKEPLSTFQRTLMVTSLNTLAKVFPQVTRRVLFNVYQNLGEAHEVRCASVIVLMRTGPPAFMLQRMAEFTNRDNSYHVISLVKSAIRSMANLDGSHHYELRMNAQAALHLLNPKELGIQYSHFYLKSYMVKELGLAYEQELSWIGSSDGLMPSCVFLATQYNIGGWKSRRMISAMAASYSDLVDAIGDQFEESETSSSSEKHDSKSDGQRSGAGNDGSHSQLTTEKIAEMLNITPKNHQQVEGNLLLPLLGANRFFTFDNTTIDNIPSLLKDAANALRSGYQYNYNKLYTRVAITLAFPTETGMPFLYSLKLPTYLSLKGELQASTHPDIASGSRNTIKIPDTVNATASLHLVWSARMSAQLSFVAPLTHQRFVAGVDTNVQINLPIKGSLFMDIKNHETSLSLQPLSSGHDSQIFHLTTIPYIAKHNILDLNPISQGDNFKVLHLREPQTMEATFGKDTTGFAFRAKYTSDQKFLDVKTVFEKFTRHDVISLFLYPWADKTINYNKITLTYDSVKSASKTATFSHSVEGHGRAQSPYENDSEESSSEFNQTSNPKGKSDESFSSSMAIPSTSKPLSETRRKEFLRKVSAEITDEFSKSYDYAAEFDGHKKISYVATYTYAASFEVDDNTRTLFYFHGSPNYARSKPFELCASVKGKWPQISFMDFSKALRDNPTIHADFDINFGERCSSGASKITIAAKGEKSNDRREWISRDPMAQECIQRAQSGVYLNPPCRMMTVRANDLDSYSISINYERIPAALKNVTYKAYSLARYFGFPYLDENVIGVENKEGKINVEINFDPDLESFNASLSAPTLNANFDRVRSIDWIKPIAIQHPYWPTVERVYFDAFQTRMPFFCGVDRDIVSTYNNRSYPIHLGKCWHVMLTQRPEEDGSPSASRDTSNPKNEVTILTRDNDSKQKELRIIVGDDVIDLKPSGSSSSKPSSGIGDASGIIYFNQKQLRMSQRRLTKAMDSNGKIIAYWFAFHNGEITIEVPKYDLVILYNGNSVWIEGSSRYRNDVAGLCGTYNGEPTTDFTSPKNCILADPEMFTASWAVPDQSCQGGAKEMQGRAKSAPCYPQTITPYDVISEQDYTAGFSSFRSSNHRSSSSKSGSNAQRS